MLTSPRLARVAFMTEQFDHVTSGPGTFAGYLRGAVAGGELDFTFFSDDMRAPAGPAERRVPPPPGVPEPAGHFLRQVAYHRAFARAHHERPFDVLWYNSAHTGYVSAMSRRQAPLVLMVNDGSNVMTSDFGAARRVFGTPRAMKRRFWREFERAAVRRADRVVVNSEFLRDRVAQAYGVRPERIRVLYKGVDLDIFRPAAPAPGALGTPLRVLFVKTNYVLGGLAELFGALARLRRPSEVTVIGPGDAEFGRIRALAGAMGYSGAVHTPGRVARADMPGRLRAHDLLCIPSRAEALGVSFLEALAAGVPAVGTAVGGIPEALDRGRAGWLAPPQDPAGLAAVLEQVVLDTEERRRRTRHGLAHVAAFSRDRLVQAVRALSEEVMAAPARPAVAAALPGG